MKKQTGFGAIVAIIVLVVLAAMSAAILKFGWGQQMGSAQDVQGARANQVAGAGVQWGLYQALQNGACNGTAQTLDLRSETGFAVTVTCTPYTADEGETSAGVKKTATFYRLMAIACNTAACPDNTQATAIGYVERARMALAEN